MKKITLLCIVICITILAQARSLTLTKIGGDSLFYNVINNPTILGFITPVLSTNKHTLTFTETILDANKNWTEEFQVMAKCINDDDVDNWKDTVHYQVIIDNGAGASYPYIVGRQTLRLGFGMPVATNNHVFYIEGNAASYVNHISINSNNNNKAYIKYKDSLLYGAWLRPKAVYRKYAIKICQDTLGNACKDSVPYYYKRAYNYDSVYPNCIAMTTAKIDTSNNGILDDTILHYFYPVVVDSLYNNDSINFVKIPKKFGVYNDGRTFAAIGNLFYISYCNQFEVKNLVCDGNLDSNFVGSNAATDGRGIQEFHCGIRVPSSKRVKITESEFNKFGLDGLSIYGVRDSINGLPNLVDNLIIKHVVCDHNGRQGLSLGGGGWGYQIDSSRFSNTGYYGNVNPQFFSPAAGIDIEPGASMHHLVFNNDTVINSSGVGVVNDDNTSSIQTTFAYNITFNNCLIDRSNCSNEYAMFISSRQFHFNNCHIIGTITQGCKSTIAGDETQFNNCVLEDVELDSVKNIYDTACGRFFSIYSSDRFARGTKFSNCTFNINHAFSRPFNFEAPSLNNTDDFMKLENCTINYNIKSYFPYANTDTWYASHLKGVIFQGDNTFHNHFSNPGFFRKLECINVIVEGNSTSCQSSNLNLIGDIILFNKDSPITIGKLGSSQKANINVFENSMLNMNYDTNKINKNCKINLYKNGNLYIGGKNLLDGSIICHDSSFIFSNNATLFSTSSTATPKMFIAPTALPRISTYVSSYYGNFYNNGTINPGNFISTLPNFCIQGGNTLVDPTLACATTYTAVQSTGAFTILYNLSNHATCSNTPNDSITISVSGGTAPYSYSLDGGATTTNTLFANLAGGTHSIVITDGAGCKDTLLFSVTGAKPLAYCCNTYFFAGTNPLYLNNVSNTYLGSTTITNQSFFINGTFIITNNITFINCHFYFTANAKIDILINATLTLNNCTLQAGCGAMWDGIYADDASEQIIMNGCTITDMENGVHVSNNARLASTNTTYKNTAKYAINLSAIVTPSQAPIIVNNTFSSDAGFIPYNVASKGQGGISVLNCGDMSVEGNSFDNIYNGINIKSDASIASVLTANNNTITCINNIFSNIMDDAANNWLGTVNSLAGKTYITPIGAGIYIDYGASPFFDAKTIVHQNITSAVYNMQNCDKAIVSINNKLEARDLKIKDCSFGIMCNSLANKKYYLHKNTIENAHLGVQVLGSTDEFTISENQILECQAQIRQIGPALINAPIGIDVKHFVPLIGNTTNYQHIQANTISIGHISGTGIAELNSNFAQNTIGNSISFTTNNSGGTTGQYTKELVGISFINSPETIIQDNQIDGLVNASSPTSALWLARQAKGIYMQDSKDCIIGCNKVKYTKQGFYAWGDNSTDEGNITYNKMHHTQTPLYTYDGPSTNIGTFGNIGNATAENANDWLYQGLGASYLPTGKKVIRNSNSILQPGVITTNNITFLDQTESDVIGTGQVYLVQNNNSTFTDPCIPVPGSFLVEPDPDNGGNGDIEITNHDINVIQGDVDYINYGTVGHWLDEKQLYYKLDRDVVLRNSDPILLSFYNIKKLAILGRIRDTDSTLRALSTMMNATNYADLFDFATDRNNDIDNGEIWEMNQRFVNNMYLQILQNGISNVDPADKIELKTLAYTCPYVGGDAVYSARNLQAIYEPNAQYNDRVICIPQALNKNSTINDNSSLDQDSLAEAQLLANANIKNYTDLIAVDDNTIKAKVLVSVNDNPQLMPNPSNGNITIIYDKEIDGVLHIYNAQGQVVETINLVSGNKRIEITLQNVSNGVYNYKFIFGKVVTNGKLIIVK
jgi:SprB repeat/Secretion system C-terminal sorting domain